MSHFTNRVIAEVILVNVHYIVYRSLHMCYALLWETDKLGRKLKSKETVVSAIRIHTEVLKTFEVRFQIQKIHNSIRFFDN